MKSRKIGKLISIATILILLASVLALLTPEPAYAQFTYVKTEVEFQWTSRVSTTDVADGDDVGTWIDLPFEFPYWGESKARVYVCSNGFALFDPTAATNDYSNSLSEMK